MFNIKKALTYTALSLISTANFAMEGYFTQDAQIHPLNLMLYTNHFEDKLLEEVKDFDGRTYGANLNVPLNEYNQIQINYPFRTKGDATSTVMGAYGKRIDISGSGGVFEFATIRFDHKFTEADNKEYSVIGFGQVGNRAAVLDTDINDRINHRGRLFGAGVRAEKYFENGIYTLGNITLDYYNDTDDLTYSDAVSFLAGDLELLIAHKNLSFLRLIQPYVELRAFGDFKKYNTYYAEVGIFGTLLKKFEVVAGYIKGLNNEADKNIVGIKIRGNTDLI